MEPNSNVFGEWLKEALKKKNMSGGELAQRTINKVSRAAVYFYLDGKRVPEPEALAVILEALGLSLEAVPPFERKPVGRRRKLPME